MAVADDLSAADQREVPKVALILGGLGLLPFIAGPVLMAIGELPWAGVALRYYAATILAFMGGIHWGLAIGAGAAERDETSARIQLIGSVIPSLVAWIALLLPPFFGLAVMALAFTLLLVGDIAAVREGWAPAWYPNLRVPLTCIVVLCLAGTAWLQ